MKDEETGGTGGGAVLKPSWPTPDYEREDVRLYCDDCLDILPHLEGIDAVITDPPYGIGYHYIGKSKGGFNARRYSDRHKQILGDNQPFDPSPWLGFPIVVLWGGNHFADRLPASPGWIVWDKICVPDTYGKFSFADCEMAWTNQKGTARIYKQMGQGCRREGEGSNWKGKSHPNQKPVSLMQFCMDKTKVPEGATVLDPYMGSGTTGIACIRTGRRFIGIEKDPEYFAVARDRIDRELSQGRLFTSAAH